MRAVRYGQWTVLGIQPQGVVMILSPQELHVLNFLCLGATNDQIATSLRISLQSAKNYVSRILDYSGAENRTQLASQVLRGQVKLALSPFYSPLPRLIEPKHLELAEHTNSLIESEETKNA